MAKKINIKALRKRLKVTQAGLAAMLGINQGTVCRIELGVLIPSKPVQMLLEQLAARP